MSIMMAAEWCWTISTSKMILLLTLKIDLPLNDPNLYLNLNLDPAKKLATRSPQLGFKRSKLQLDVRSDQLIWYIVMAFGEQCNDDLNLSVHNIDLEPSDD